MAELQAGEVPPGRELKKWDEHTYYVRLNLQYRLMFLVIEGVGHVVAVGTHDDMYRRAAEALRKLRKQLRDTGGPHS